MTYAYGTKGSPAVGKGLGGLPRREEEVAAEAVPYSKSYMIDDLHAAAAGWDIHSANQTWAGMPRVNNPWYYYPYPDNMETISIAGLETHDVIQRMDGAAVGGSETLIGSSSRMKRDLFRAGDLNHVSYRWRFNEDTSMIAGHVGENMQFAFQGNSSDNAMIWSGLDALTGVPPSKDMIVTVSKKSGGSYYDRLRIGIVPFSEDEDTAENVFFNGILETQDVKHLISLIVTENYITVVHQKNGNSNMWFEMWDRPTLDDLTQGSNYTMTWHKSFYVNVTALPTSTSNGYIHSTPDYLGRVWITWATSSNTGGFVLCKPEDEYFASITGLGHRQVLVTALKDTVLLQATTAGEAQAYLLKVGEEQNLDGTYPIGSRWNAFDGNWRPNAWSSAAWGDTDTTFYYESNYQPAIIHPNGMHFLTWSTYNNYTIETTTHTRNGVDERMYWINGSMLSANDNKRTDNPSRAVMPLYLSDYYTDTTMWTHRPGIWNFAFESGSMSGTTPGSTSLERKTSSGDRIQRWRTINPKEELNFNL